MKTPKWRVSDQWLWLAAAAAVTLLIWRNSLFPATESAAQSSYIMELLTPSLSATPLPVENWHTLIRKLAHITEFALLGAFWTAALTRIESGGCPVKKVRVCHTLFICVLTAMVDETIQAFVPGRGSLVTDIWIDTLGAVIGSGISWLILRRRQRMQRHKDN